MWTQLPNMSRPKSGSSCENSCEESVFSPLENIPLSGVKVKLKLVIKDKDVDKLL